MRESGREFEFETHQVPFQAHIELLHFFLAHRDDIVERIQGVLNAQRKPIRIPARHVPSVSSLRGLLLHAHWRHRQPIAPARSIGRSALGKWIQAS